MERYILREPRAGAECRQGNQNFPTNTAANNEIPDTFYTPYGSEYQNVPENRYLPHKSYQANMMQGQTPIMSGIDPTYLSAYANNNAQYIATGPTGHQQMYREMQMERQMQFRSDPSFGSDYQNRSLVHAEKNNCKTFARTVPCESPRQIEIINTPRINNYDRPKVQSRPQSPPRTPSDGACENAISVSPSSEEVGMYVPHKKESEEETPKLEIQVLSRMDKLKIVHKNGPRAFTGPVEKVLKWHKALQDIGVLIIYEIIAKCVSIDAGKSCSKNLVVREENGRAMQIVFYEIDYLLPELKLPSIVRVVGRMMPGTCRLQAFSVRPATGDDVATLPRRAAVASHHVNKMFKDFL